MQASNLFKSMVGGHDPNLQTTGPAVYELELPPPAVAKERFHLEAEDFRAQIEKAESWSLNFRTRSSMHPAIEHGKAPKLGDLQSVSLRKVALKMNQIHSSSVVFVKTIDEPFRVVALQTIVQDDFGDCVKCSLYNFGRMEIEDPILPNGSFLALLAPYMKTEEDILGGTPMLRCDNPQCVVVFDTEKAWKAAKAKLPITGEHLSFQELRLLGNKAFQAGIFQKAARFYTRALAVDGSKTDDILTCLSNRAAAYLRTEQWEYAEADARRAIALSSGSHIKARYRLARALLHLNRPHEAATMLDTFIDSQPKELIFQKLRSDCIRCQGEQAGHYNVLEMYNEACRPRSERPFHADFVSDKIEVGVDIQQSQLFTYRGTRANMALKQGELILASKALAFSEVMTGSMHMSFDPHAMACMHGKYDRLVFDVVSLIAHRPAMGSKVYQLEAGKGFEESVTEEAQGLVDLPRIRRILLNNQFGASNLADVLKRRYDRSKFDKVEESVGIWAKESLLNHSCTPNCVFSVIGDHMFVHTNRPIELGEELCISYTASEGTYQERVDKFKNWVCPGNGFVCQCRHCQLLRTNKVLRNLEKEVYDTYATVFKGDAWELTSPLARPRMINQLLPLRRRREILEAHSHLPLSLQHYTIYRVWLMEGIVCASERRFQDALLALERGVDVLKAIDGSFNSERHALRLWRIAQLRLLCGNTEGAVHSLEEIVHSCLALVPEKGLLVHFLATVPGQTFDPSFPSMQNELLPLALRVFSSTKKALAPTTNKRY